MSRDGRHRSTSTDVGRLRAALRRVGVGLRAVLGAPDYERYLAHRRTQHGDAPPLSRAEFARQCLEARYSRAGSRCC